jgi:hypothetical protein
MIKTVNLKEIRARLPHGSLTRISEKVGVSPKMVSEVFEHGWHPGCKNEVITTALELIEEAAQGTEVATAKASEMGFMTHNLLAMPLRKKKKIEIHGRKQKGFGKIFLIVGLAIAVIAFFFRKKLFPKLFTA